jgi:hypothetical protein
MKRVSLALPLFLAAVMLLAALPAARAQPAAESRPERVRQVLRSFMASRWRR